MSSASERRAAAREAAAFEAAIAASKAQEDAARERFEARSAAEEEAREAARGQSKYNVGVGYAFVGEFDFSAQLIETVSAATSEVAKTLLDLVTILQRRGYRGVFEEASSQVAKGAQAKVVESYHQARRRSYRAGTPPYRSGQGRFSGGALLGALQSGNFITIGPGGGILYADIGVLNAAAKQWRRLNFGAGAGGVLPRPFAVRGSRAVGNLGVFELNEDTADSFGLPGGIWVGSGQDSTRPFGRSRGRTDFFYPASQSQLAPGPGTFQHPIRSGLSIKGENWLDAGLQYIAENIGSAYIRAMAEKVVRPAMRDAATSVHARRVLTGLTGARPSTRTKTQGVKGARGATFGLGRI